MECRSNIQRAANTKVEADRKGSSAAANVQGGGEKDVVIEYGGLRLARHGWAAGGAERGKPKWEADMDGWMRRERQVDEGEDGTRPVWLERRSGGGGEWYGMCVIWVVVVVFGDGWWLFVSDGSSTAGRFTQALFTFTNPPPGLMDGGSKLGKSWAQVKTGTDRGTDRASVGAGGRRAGSLSVLQRRARWARWASGPIGGQQPTPKRAGAQNFAQQRPQKFTVRVPPRTPLFLSGASTDGHQARQCARRSSY